MLALGLPVALARRRRLGRRRGQRLPPQPRLDLPGRRARRRPRGALRRSPAHGLCTQRRAGGHRGRRRAPAATCGGARCSASGDAPHLRALPRLGLRAGGPRVTARHARAAATLVAGLALLAVRGLAVRGQGGPLRLGPHPRAVSRPDAGRPHADDRHARRAGARSSCTRLAAPTSRGRSSSPCTAQARPPPSSRAARASAAWPTARTSSWPTRVGRRSDAWNTAALDQLEAAVCVDRRPRLRHRRVERRWTDGAAGVRSVRAPGGRGVGGRRLSDAAAVHARAPAAGARDPRHRRPGLPLRRPRRATTRPARGGCWGGGGASTAATGTVDRLKLAPGVTEVAWRHCSAATRVEHVRLDGRARGWPRGPRTQPLPAPFAATWRTWQFFRSLPPRPPVQTS